MVLRRLNSRAGRRLDRRRCTSLPLRFARSAAEERLRSKAAIWIHHSMSLEYSASAKLTEDEVSLLKVSLLNNYYVLASAPSATQLLLRFGGRPAREEWPEDIDLRFADTVYVAIHSGTEAERKNFLRYLGDCLRDLGQTCDFEED